MKRRNIETRETPNAVGALEQRAPRARADQRGLASVAKQRSPRTPSTRCDSNTATLIPTRATGRATLRGALVQKTQRPFPKNRTFWPLTLAVEELVYGQ